VWVIETLDSLTVWWDSEFRTPLILDALFGFLQQRDYYTPLLMELSTYKSHQPGSKGQWLMTKRITINMTAEVGWTPDDG